MSLAVIAWVLGGGLRRKQRQEDSAIIVPGIIIIATRPHIESSPLPNSGVGVDPVLSDGNETMHEP
jgi:hypothetical protein